MRCSLGFQQIFIIILDQSIDKAINIQQMSKNVNPVPKSWKSSQDVSKIINSQIIDNVYKPLSPHHQSVLPQNLNQTKTAKFHPLPKTGTFQRHYSQEDFKKFTPTNQIFHVDSPKVEDQYFPELGKASKSKHAIKTHSIQKSAKGFIVKPNIKQKNIQSNINFRLNGLKQTSSTQSAQNLCIFKPMPNFVRSKILKAQSNNQNNDYFNHHISSPRNLIKRQNFKIISKLGEGKFGKVFLVKQIFTGFALAMKIVEKRKIIQQNLLQQFVRQLRIQSYLQHPNVISLYGLFSDETHFYALMQLGCDGQLYSLIHHKKILTEEATSFIIKNLLEAVHYMHSNKVLHRDIKPQNIVLIMGNVKVCDFGWAVNKLHPGQLRTTFCGTPLYLSPQILQGNRYDQKVDLWAIGILAFELYIGCSPFDINDQSDLYKIATQSISFPENREVSQQFKEFINSMLNKNPNERLTSKKLLQMEFIKKYKDFETCEELCK